MGLDCTTTNLAELFGQRLATKAGHADSISHTLLRPLRCRKPKLAPFASESVTQAVAYKAKHLDGLR